MNRNNPQNAQQIPDSPAIVIYQDVKKQPFISWAIKSGFVVRFMNTIVQFMLTIFIIMYGCFIGGLTKMESVMIFYWASLIAIIVALILFFFIRIARFVEKRRYPDHGASYGYIHQDPQQMLDPNAVYLPVPYAVRDNQFVGPLPINAQPFKYHFQDDQYPRKNSPRVQHRQRKDISREILEEMSRIKVAQSEKDVRLPLLDIAESGLGYSQQEEKMIVLSENTEINAPPNEIRLNNKELEEIQFKMVDDEHENSDEEAALLPNNKFKFSFSTIRKIFSPNKSTQNKEENNMQDILYENKDKKVETSLDIA